MESYELKVGPETANKFCDDFYNAQDLVVCCVDSITARGKIQESCIYYNKVLLDTGLQDAAARVRAFIPNQTVTYGTYIGNQTDAEFQENAEVAACTLRMYPYERLHCLQWARQQYFEELFNKDESREIINGLTDETLVDYMRSAFSEEYVDYMHKLMEDHPEDSTNEDGGKFWETPRIFPHALEMDPTNLNYLSFLLGGACVLESI